MSNRMKRQVSVLSVSQGGWSPLVTIEGDYYPDPSGNNDSYFEPFYTEGNVVALRGAGLTEDEIARYLRTHVALIRETATPATLSSTSPGNVAVAEVVLGPIQERAKQMLLSTEAGKKNAELLDEFIEAASEEILRTVRSLSVVASQLDTQQALTPPAEIEQSSALRQARAAAHEKLAAKVATTAVQALLMVV